MPGAERRAEAAAAVAQGDHAAALELFGALSQQEPENAKALAGVARALLALGEEDQALAVLDSAPDKIKEASEITAARSAIEIEVEGRRAKSMLAEFENRLAADPDDHAARIDLAIALNAAENREAAVDALIEAIRRDRAWNEEAARKQLLKFFEAWGFDDPASKAGRRKLAGLLFR
jgi:putative thioredoxin